MAKKLSTADIESLPVEGPGAHPLLHEVLGGYLSDKGDRAVILVRDKVDNDFSGVILDKDGENFKAVDLFVSEKTREGAESRLLSYLSN